MIPLMIVSMLPEIQPWIGPVALTEMATGHPISMMDGLHRTLILQKMLQSLKIMILPMLTTPLMVLQLLPAMKMDICDYGTLQQVPISGQ